MSLNTQRHCVGEKITGVWNHGNVSDAVNNLLQIQKSYTITERLPSGVVVGTVMTTGIDIRDRCNYLLGKITHIYEITLMPISNLCSAMFLVEMQQSKDYISSKISFGRK